MRAKPRADVACCVRHFFAILHFASRQRFELPPAIRSTDEGEEGTSPSSPLSAK